DGLGQSRRGLGIGLVKLAEQLGAGTAAAKRLAPGNDVGVLAAISLQEILKGASGLFDFAGWAGSAGRGRARLLLVRRQAGSHAAGGQGPAGRLRAVTLFV